MKLKKVTLLPGQHSMPCMLDVSADLPTTLTQLFPLLYEKAATAAMIKHGMNVSRLAIEFFNPGQIPVVAFDAPLYALAKFTQWKWPDTHGEERKVHSDVWWPAHRDGNVANIW